MADNGLSEQRSLALLSVADHNVQVDSRTPIFS